MVCHVLDQILEEHDHLVYLFHHLHGARRIADTSSSRIKVSPFLKDSLPCAFQLWQQKLLDVWNEKSRQRASLSLNQHGSTSDSVQVDAVVNFGDMLLVPFHDNSALESNDVWKPINRGGDDACAL